MKSETIVKENVNNHWFASFCKLLFMNGIGVADFGPVAADAS